MDVDIEITEFLGWWYVIKVIHSKWGNKSGYLNSHGRWVEFGVGVRFDTKEEAEITLAKNQLLEQSDG